nr:PIG-L deacetylase family protein [Streptomyces sp. SID4913]
MTPDPRERGLGAIGVRVVAIAPHPDDELIGAGGSLIAHARDGADITTVHVVERDRSTLDDELDDAAFQAEVDQANKLLGVTRCVQLFRRSRDLSLSRDLRLALVEVLRTHRPDIVYLPHADEADQEHELVHRLAMDALWMAGSKFFGEAGPVPAPPPSLILGYEVWTPMRRFSYVQDIGDVLDQKVEAMRAYTSQLRHARWDSAIRGLSAYRGAVALGGGSAEVFEVLRYAPRGGVLPDGAGTDPAPR